MANSSIKKVNETFTQTKSILFENQIIRLTPKEVTTFEDSLNAGLLSARYEAIYNNDIQRSIHETNWTFKDSGTAEITQWTAGIYTCGAKFPELCMTCMKPVEHYEVIELCKSKNVSIGRQMMRGTTQKEAIRISFAFLWDRFWIPVPFCKEHNLKSKAIHIKKSYNKFTFGFTNKQYGESFAELNNLKGFWRTKSNLFNYKVLFPFLLYLSGLGIFLGILGLIRGFKGKLGEAVATPYDIPIGIVSVVIAIIVIIIVIRRILKFEATITKIDQE